MLVFLAAEFHVEAVVTYAIRCVGSTSHMQRHLHETYRTMLKSRWHYGELHVTFILFSGLVAII